MISHIDLDPEKKNLLASRLQCTKEKKKTEKKKMMVM